MPKIEVTAKVMSAIWNAAQEGEEDVAQILERIFTAKTALGSPVVGGGLKRVFPQGWTDARFNIYFPEGFRIYRTRDGKSHEAKVYRGRWRLDDNPLKFNKISSLNVHLNAKTESVWTSWFYDDENGVKQPLLNLRKI